MNTYIYDHLEDTDFPLKKKKKSISVFEKARAGLPTQYESSLMKETEIQTLQESE